MGIRDRDYMKRPLGDEGRDGTPSDSKAEEFARRLFQNRRRLISYALIGLAILTIIAVIIAKLSPTNH